MVEKLIRSTSKRIKTREIRFKVSQEDYETISFKAKAINWNVAQLVRYLCLNSNVKVEIE